MIYTILDNSVILLLTILGLFYCQSPVALIIVAAALMTITTYNSFCEEKTKIVTVFQIIAMTIFAVLTGNFTGFLVFVLIKNVKEYIRIMMGCMLYIFSFPVMSANQSAAICILQTMFLVVLSLLIIGVYRTIRWGEKRKENETLRVVQANISELHEKRLNEQLVLQKLSDEKNARLLERENISRNIHNSVGHSITAAIMTLDAADMLYDVKPEEARKKMNDANSRIRGSLESIRRAVRVLDEENKLLSAKDLKEELKRIATEFVMDTSMEVFQNFGDISDDIQISDEHVLFLTGVLQESLTNGVKHGNANEFVVYLVGDSAHIRLEISDNGCSDFAESNKHTKIENGFGLKKIASYAKKNGGKALFSNDNGFKTIVELPILGDRINE